MLSMARVPDARTRVPSESPPRSFVIREGEYVTLDGSDASPLIPKRIATDSLLEFKDWIGVPDDNAPPLDVLEKYWPTPPPCTFPQAQLHELSIEQLALIDAAAWQFVFGDSRRVQTYKTVIETISSPFVAALYTVDELTVMAGATLAINGTPAILRVGRLKIHSTGKIVTYTPTHGTFNELQKCATNGTLAN